MSDKLEVTLFNLEGEPIAEYIGEEAVDYVSYVSADTYGKPALVAPDGSGGPRSTYDQTVLYVNTRFVPFWEITRVQ
jgi:hypothetical protein